MNTTATAIIDPGSGLFTEAFLRATLPTRVATARRAMKQLGLVFIQVTPRPADPGSPDPGAPQADQPDLSVAVGALIRDTLRDSDTGILLDDGRFALMLEFTPVDGCIIIGNRLSDRLVESHPELVMRLGVATYPVHAIDAPELLQAAERALRAAGEQGAAGLAVAPIAD